MSVLSIFLTILLGAAVVALLAVASVARSFLRERRELTAELRLAREDQLRLVTRLNGELEDARAALHQARAEIANFAAPPAASITPFTPPEVSGRKCANCKHFDLEEGQAAMKQHPVFSELGRHVSPAKMANKTLYDEQGKRRPEEEQPPDVLPAKAKWADFGACSVHRELRYREDSCEQFEEVVAIRLPQLRAQA